MGEGLNLISEKIYFVTQKKVGVRVELTICTLSNVYYILFVGFDDDI